MSFEEVRNQRGVRLTLSEIIAACSDETSLLTTGQKLVFQNFVMKSVSAFRASVTEAPTGSATVVQIRTGTTVLSTVTINAGSKHASASTVSLSGFNDFLADNTLPVELNVNIEQIGSTTAGKGLKVYLEGQRP